MNEGHNFTYNNASSDCCSSKKDLGTKETIPNICKVQLEQYQFRNTQFVQNRLAALNLSSGQ